MMTFEAGGSFMTNHAGHASCARGDETIQVDKIVPTRGLLQSSKLRSFSSPHHAASPVSRFIGSMLNSDELLAIRRGHQSAIIAG